MSRSVISYFEKYHIIGNEDEINEKKRVEEIIIYISEDEERKRDREIER